MIVQGNNVNETYREGLALLKRVGVTQVSRAGEVIVSPFPVVTVTRKPWQRVLFSEARDANPFFHLFEALWMLRGECNATQLDRWVSDFSSRFAEEDGRQHGAYGYRWRRHFDLEGGGEADMPDQLMKVISLLKTNPLDRRIVLAMWDPIADLGADKKDIPCNTHIYFRVRNGCLDMTVCCRSNDIIWGAYGANAVHFSVLQEVIAQMCGFDIGIMYQLSNNYHAYQPMFDKQVVANHESEDEDAYLVDEEHRVPIVNDPETFFVELEVFWGCLLNEQYDVWDTYPWRNSFFPMVAKPMYHAHNFAKLKQWEDADIQCDNILAYDWSCAAYNWISRREKRHAARNG
jgi:thymidylate synthase